MKSKKFLVFLPVVFMSLFGLIKKDTIQVSALSSTPIGYVGLGKLDFVNGSDDYVSGIGGLSVGNEYVGGINYEDFKIFATIGNYRAYNDNSSWGADNSLVYINIFYVNLADTWSTVYVRNVYDFSLTNYLTADEWFSVSYIDFSVARYQSTQYIGVSYTIDYRLLNNQPRRVVDSVLINLAAPDFAIAGGIVPHTPINDLQTHTLISSMGGMFYENAFNNGYNSGLQIGYDSGLDYGYDSGLQIGYDSGLDYGYGSGYTIGYQNAEAESTLMSDTIFGTAGAVVGFLATLGTFSILGVSLLDIVTLFIGVGAVILILKVIK